MKFISLLRQAQFHGAVRLTEQSYRWWWTLAIFLLFGCSVTVVVVTINRFMDNPTFLVHQEKIYSTMAFPSVLVCPEITFPDDKIDQFVREMRYPQRFNSSYMKDVIRQLAAFFSLDVVYKQQDLENIEHLLYYNGLDMDTAGRRLMTTCEETLIRCRWNGDMVDCSTLFQMELTGDGYCCVFNGRSLSREIIEYGIHGKQSDDEWLMSNYGFTSGLMLVVNQTQKLDNVDLSYKWIALQGSQHYVETTVNGTPLNPGSEHWASYTSQAFQIEDDARSLDDRVRRCLMSDQPLKLFPTYHRDYCLLECELERTIERCNCARAVHPKLPGVRACRTRNLLCAKHAMISSDTEECDCPQACDVASDIVQTTSFQLMPGVQSFDAFYENLNFSAVTIVRVFLKSRVIKSKSRWSFFTALDLFSQLGGVFNVFLGVSILSILELIQLAWHGLRPRKKVTRQPGLILVSKPGKVVKTRRVGKVRKIKTKAT